MLEKGVLLLYFPKFTDCALCRHDVRAWRARCTGRGEVPVGRGALDEQRGRLSWSSFLLFPLL
eukprot:1676320-Amphidinium_carterae.1